MGYFGAWAVMTVFLMTMANFRSTEKLGASFAYLVLVAVLMANSTKLIDHLKNGYNQGVAVKTTPNEKLQTQLSDQQHP